MASERPYTLLCEARELIGRADARIKEACEQRGPHIVPLIGVGVLMEEVIEQLNDACGKAAQRP